MSASRPPAGSSDPPIDTTPTLPRPPEALIDAAGRAIPPILADIDPAHYDEHAVRLDATDLVTRLENAGHGRAAAHWAIHEAVTAGRLTTAVRITHLPAAYLGGPESLQRVTQAMLHFHSQGHDPLPIRWENGRRVAGGGTARATIPKDGPTPFDKFTVTPTERLWEWWRTFELAAAKPGAVPDTAGSVSLREFVSLFEDLDAANANKGPFAWGIDGSPASLSSQIQGAANHECYKAGLRSDIARTPGSEGLRAFTLAHLGEELSVSVLNRVKGELLRRGLAKSPTEAEGLTVGRVAELLSPIPSETQQGPSVAAAYAPDALAVLRVYTNGAAEERIQKATELVANTALTVSEKLSKMDALIPIPATASAEQLGEMFTPKVSKQAVMKSDWWQANRKGEKASEVGRRRTTHKMRSKSHGPTTSPDSDFGG